MIGVIAACCTTMVYLALGVKIVMVQSVLSILYDLNQITVIAWNARKSKQKMTEKSNDVVTCLIKVCLFFLLAHIKDREITAIMWFLCFQFFFFYLSVSSIENQSIDYCRT